MSQTTKSIAFEDHKKVTNTHLAPVDNNEIVEAYSNMLPRDSFLLLYGNQGGIIRDILTLGKAIECELDAEGVTKNSWHHLRLPHCSVSASKNLSLMLKTEQKIVVKNTSSSSITVFSIVKIVETDKIKTHHKKPVLIPAHGTVTVEGSF